MRGGVTTLKAQHLTRLPEDVFGEILEMHPLFTPKFNNITLRRAVRDYLNIRARSFLVSKYGHISQWDVSNVTDMSFVFSGAISSGSFNEPINNWNVSNVRNMESMFLNATSFNQPLNKWNVSKVTYMYSMFRGATSFNQPLNNWNVSNVEDMGDMFDGARSFNQPLNKWNVSNVTDMKRMFHMLN